MSDATKISAFWLWFSDHDIEFGSKNVTQDLIKQLEEKLFSIKRLDWEIGPGTNGAHQFALSARGDDQTAEIARAIIQQAPVIFGWEFFAAKPPKNWNLVFNLMVEDKLYQFNGKQWEFVAYKFKDGTYDLVFKPDFTNGLPEKYLQWAGTIIVDGEIGEEKSINKVEKIEIVSDWDERSLSSAKRLEVGLLAKIII